MRWHCGGCTSARAGTIGWRVRFGGCTARVAEPAPARLFVPRWRSPATSPTRNSHRTLISAIGGRWCRGIGHDLQLDGTAIYHVTFRFEVVGRSSQTGVNHGRPTQQEAGRSSQVPVPAYHPDHCRVGLVLDARAAKRAAWRGCRQRRSTWPSRARPRCRPGPAAHQLAPDAGGISCALVSGFLM